MLDTHELSIFLTAAQTENFSEAARQLHLTQPAVSMQIRALERKLEIDLFHRHGRTLMLTEQGKALIPMARNMLRYAVQIEEEIEALKGEVSGHLKIACSTTTGKYILPRLVARFRRRHPRVQVTIHNLNRQAALARLMDGESHLAIVSAAPSYADLEYRHFFDDNVVLIVPVHHPWAGREGIALPELREGDFILRDAESGTREEINTAFREAGLNVDELNIVMEIGNSEAISMAVEEGIGAAFVSRTVARRAIQLGLLNEVKVEGLTLSRAIFVAYNTRHPASRAQQTFWEFTQEVENRTLLQEVA